MADTPVDAIDAKPDSQTDKTSPDSTDGPIIQQLPSSTAGIIAKTQLKKYNMNHKRRGLALIINNRYFDELLTGQKERIGTDTDADNLEEIFGILGFEVRRYDSMTTNDMSIRTRLVSEEDHSDADCFVCAILSHGEEGYIYSKNGKLKLEQMVKNFKNDRCPSLAGKPKLFFIQACRGRHYDFGTEVSADETDAFPEEPKVRKIPTEADVLMAYSVVPGYFSWRNSEDGSWFIQALVRVLREHGTSMEIMQMMTLVNQVVAYEFESCTDSAFTDHMKQCPCVVSMLTKQIFFHNNE